LYLYQHWYSPKNRYSAKLSVVIAYSVECDRTSRKVMGWSSIRSRPLN